MFGPNGSCGVQERDQLAFFAASLLFNGAVLTVVVLYSLSCGAQERDHRKRQAADEYAAMIQDARQEARDGEEWQTRAEKAEKAEAGLRELVRGLEAQVTEAQVLYVELQGQMRESELELSGMRGEVDALKESVGEAEEDVIHARGERDALRREVEELQGELRVVRGERDAMQRTLMGMEEMIGGAGRGEEVLRKRCEGLEAEVRHALHQFLLEIRHISPVSA